MLQIQTGLLVIHRKWVDYASYCGGMPMVSIRVLPDPKIQDAIIAAATAFEQRLTAKLGEYSAAIKSGRRLVPTQRRIEQEITI